MHDEGPEWVISKGVVIGMKRLGVCISVVLCLLLSASLALGRSSYQDRRAAKKLAREGKALVKRGEFKRAAKKFKKADDLVPAPSYKLELAKMLIELGDLVRAGEVLEAATETRPRQWVEKKARKRSRKLLDEVHERTPTLEVQIFEPEASEVSVTVDDEEYDVADGAVPMNPGEYQVTAEADGYQPFDRTVNLEEGDRQSLEITLKKIGAKDGEDEADEKGSGGLSPIPAYIAWGVGGVALGLGVGFGIAAIKSTNEVLQFYNCDNSVCPPEAADDLATARLNGNISTAGFVIGGVGAAAGTVLFLFADTGDADEAADEDSDPDEAGGLLRLEARPLLGPGFVGLTGTF